MEHREDRKARMKADLQRRRELEHQLSELYARRAGREKHLSRIIPEYSKEWDTETAIGDRSKRGEEKMVSAEMMLLDAERQDLIESETDYLEAVRAKIRDIRRLGVIEEADALEHEAHAIAARCRQVDEAATCGQRLIRQTGYIKRCLDQALKFRLGRSGLSEPLKAALRGVDQMEPMIRDFHALIGKQCIRQDLREKVKYCQVDGADWVWEVFDYDIMGLISRLFHRPDLGRFSMVDAELIDVRFQVYGMMSQLARERSRLVDQLAQCGEKCGV